MSKKKQDRGIELTRAWESDDPCVEFYSDNDLRLHLKDISEVGDSYNSEIRLLVLLDLFYREVANMINPKVVRVVFTFASHINVSLARKQISKRVAAMREQFPSA